jgi:hypothetical protein
MSCASSVTVHSGFFITLVNFKTPSFDFVLNLIMKKRRTSKKNVDGRCTTSHENKTFRSRSVVKQKGMVFGFWKTATAVTRPES